MFRENELLHRMIEKYGVTKDELQAVLRDREELEEEYGKAIQLLGQFDEDALEDVANFDKMEEHQNEH